MQQQTDAFNLEKTAITTLYVPKVGRILRPLALHLNQHDTLPPTLQATGTCLPRRRLCSFQARNSTMKISRVSLLVLPTIALAASVSVPFSDSAPSAIVASSPRHPSTLARRQWHHEQIWCHNETDWPIWTCEFIHIRNVPPLLHTAKVRPCMAISTAV